MQSGEIELSAKEKWLKWRDSGLYLRVENAVYYWAFNCVFEKHKGVTSTRIGKNQAASILSAIDNNKAEFLDGSNVII